MNDLGPRVEGWRPRAHPRHGAFAGTHVDLRPLELTDAPALFQAFAEDRAGTDWTYLPYGPFDDLAAFTDWLQTACLGTDPQFYVFTPKGAQAPQGMAALMRLEHTHGVAEVGHIHFAPALQRTPAATQGLFLLMDHCLADLGYRRFEWKCNALNEGSRRAALRLGFTFEGIFRQMNIFKGRSRDTAWFSILDREWPEIRAGFEAWLEANNFGNDGGQFKSLAECRD